MRTLEMGYQVVAVRWTGRWNASQGQFDLLLTDLKMPRMNNGPISHHSRLQATPAIMMTGFGTMGKNEGPPNWGYQGSS